MRKKKIFLQIVIQNITSLFKIDLYPYPYQNMYIFFYRVMTNVTNVTNVTNAKVVYFLTNDKYVTRKVNYKDIKDNFLIKRN